MPDNKTRGLYADLRLIDDQEYNTWREDGETCAWCGIQMMAQPFYSYHAKSEFEISFRGWPHMCDKCGWWVAQHEQGSIHHELKSGSPYTMRTISCGVIRKLDISSSDLPLGVLIDHLKRHYSDRFELTPAMFEELVKSVFSDFFKCEVEYFAGNTNTPDGGIDLIMINSYEGSQTAIQVKRRSHSKKLETVASIRDFVGALFIEGFPHGVFVTTTSYTRIAKNIPLRLAEVKGKPIALDLVNASRFYDMLGETGKFPFSERPWFDAMRRFNPGTW